MLAAEKYAGHSTALTLYCRNDYCLLSVPEIKLFKKETFAIYSKRQYIVQV